jgi:nitrate ABC transporter ATP-binding subunit
MVMGLTEPTIGGVILDGREVDGPGTDRGVVFQSASLFPWLTVGENIRLAIAHLTPRRTVAQQRAVVEEALRQVGLPDAANSRPEELSAGMRQRVGIARALAMDPKILLLDEPFSLLDALTRMELQDELMRLWERRRKTVLMVTHDVDEALLLADRIVMMTAGPAATVGEILTVPFGRPRSRAALADHPDYYVARDRLIAFLEAGASTPHATTQEP